MDEFELVENTSDFTGDLIKKYDDKTNVGYFLKANITYPQHIKISLNDLPFLPQKMRIDKQEKCVCNFNDKYVYVLHVRNLKQVLNLSL